MKLLLKKALFAAIRDTALVYSLLLLLALYVFDLSPYLLAVLIGISVFAGGAAGYRLRTEAAYLAAMAFPVLSAALLIAVGLMDGRGILLLVVLGLAGARGVQQAGRASRDRKETLIVCCWLVVGAFVYAWTLQHTLLSPYSLSVYIALTVALLGLFLRWNELRVREAMGVYRDEEVPMNRLKRFNAVFMIGFMLLVLLIGGATQLAVVLDWIVHLWRLLWSGTTDGQTIEPPMSTGDEFAEPEETPSDDENEMEDQEVGWMRWIAWGVAAIVLAVIGATLFFLLRWLYTILAEWLPDWLKRLLENLRITVRAIQEPEQVAYADTTEKLEPRKRSRKRSSAKVDEPPDGPRREYFKLVQAAIRRGYVFRPWKTPTETGREIEALIAADPENSARVEDVVERYNHSRYKQENNRS
ncbi:DUF4129 domain-containing protein [Saccharibacillus endophyticus]|uniref:DUF4129 domain-containing protein n=1 Tax=Saccharibacillus endophyticus TaxID=2060666 RepID=A0ABQ2A5J1_9BACL|nr:DUF4129 domain-containing protein [Saccharibacillus endophyticus]GGH85335.1 hypothetical protein GCM10007362_42530 [Saccharibacillus endophyticus]